jgi:hypothetical protein
MDGAQNVPEFKWTAAKHEAAYMLAEDRLTDEEIAEKSGVTRRALQTWKERPEFREKVQQIADKLASAVFSRGIARRANRIRVLNEQHEKMQAVIKERAADASMADVPGGKTGLVVRQVKGVGKGDDFQVVHEYAVDTALLKEIREHHKQVAQELGQWTEKHVIGGDPEKPFLHEHGHRINPAALRAFTEDLAAAGLDDLSENGGGEPVDPQASPG